MKSFWKKISFAFILFVFLILSIGISFWLGIWIGVNKIAYCVYPPDTINFSLFWDAYYKLKENFIDSSRLEDQKILYGAIKGMAESLGDPYTTFFNPEEAKRFLQDLAGSFEGIGAEIGIKNSMLTIIAPLEGTPAQKAGLKAGDVILKINEKETSNLSLYEAVNLIRGPRGTKVTLTIFREEWKTPKEITIVREVIVIPSLKWTLVDNEVAHIQIFQFGDNLPSEFRNAALEILKSPAKKIILDLRNNPGGYLEVAQEIAGWFLEEDQIITIEDFGEGKEKKYFKSKGNALLANYPVVVLINEGSASGSEILAGALRDNKGVKLVGTKSFGKGSVQEAINLRGGSFLKVTIAKWLTPKGELISEKGLEPDIKVEIRENDLEENKDPQLEKALEIVKTLN